MLKFENHWCRILSISECSFDFTYKIKNYWSCISPRFQNSIRKPNSKEFSGCTYIFLWNWILRNEWDFHRWRRLRVKYLRMWGRLGLFQLDGKLSFRFWKLSLGKPWLLGSSPQEICLWMFIFFCVFYYTNTECKNHVVLLSIAFGLEFISSKCLSLCRP